MQTLINTFHDTEYRTRKTDEQLEAIAYRIYSGTASDAEKSLLRKINNALCGSPDCTCGDDFGRRN